MKCIIFLGHHKTGSSALQEFFTRNASKLRKNGVLYPFVEPKGAAYVKLHRADKAHKGALPARLRSPHNFIAYQMMAESVASYSVPKRFAPLPSVDDMFADIADQVARTKPHTLLLCSEVFSHFGMRCPAVIQDLLTRLGATDVTFYLTLRRPDQHIAAWHSQMLKFGRKPKKLSQGGLDWFEGTSHLELERTAAPWVAAAAPGKMHLHTYTSIMKTGGVVPHFSQAVGLDISQLDTVTLSTNVSIPYALFDLCAQANRDLPRAPAAHFRKLLHIHRADLPVPPNAQVEVFGQNVRDDIYDRVAPMDTALAKMTGQSTFFEDLDKIRQMHAIPQEQASVTALVSVKQGLMPRLGSHADELLLKDWLAARV